MLTLSGWSGGTLISTVAAVFVLEGSAGVPTTTKVEFENVSPKEGSDWLAVIM